VLQAIANHTLEQTRHGLLSCTVFLADTLEPGRDDTPGGYKLTTNKLSKSIIQAVWLTCDYSLKYLLAIV